ncbi:MAG: tRNA (cytidine(34)-2'-O)-methyltransferase [Myxococcales bacterium]|jgi:tRNA (cytidine/uridine-2'-O-)-methyltransferase|nr:tRNA (cytidine(34)-2'-O)-methyltransferase [Myxococcales bacterium]
MPTPVTLTPSAPPLTLVLVEPQIPPNTGNVARLCAVTGARLCLVGPLGFSIAQKDLRRAGLDYWDKVFQAFFPTLDDYLAEHATVRRHLFSSHAATSLWEADFRPGDHLIFGSEPRGLPKALLERFAERGVTIPMLPDRRCLNLSTAVGIAAYEALRQIRLCARP